jgi:molybdopterin-guanine dinucleotide biosynthesis protein A
MLRVPDPIGAVLAGGLGRRIGGSKATVLLAGRPLIAYPIAALTAVLGEIAVVAKPDTELPSLPGVTVWIEPAEPRHPLVGIVQALALAEGRPVLVCAGDLPFVTPALVSRIARADPGGAPAVVPRCLDRLEPLLALYLPEAARLLAAAVERGSAPLREVVGSIGPRLLDLEAVDADALFNVNAPEDLLHAAALLDRRDQPNVNA